MGMRLYEIPAIIDDVLENSFHVDGETGEVFDEDDLEALDMALDEKLEATALYVKSLDAEADAIKAEEKRLNDRRKSIEKRSESLEDYIARTMVRSGKKKVETPKCLLRTRKTERVEVLDKSEVPDYFMRSKLVIEPDKNELKKRLKAGEIIPGCVLVSGESLTIK